ncbi:SDR family oxidoreductase [Hyphobacterium sp.]|uniref:SDR family oxidoreductase n=1 Tax=Hyphobacterium sp. TaxID=2004662 RepID=UPI003B524694
MTHVRSALLLGCGYVAKATAPLLRDAGFALTGTTRTAAKADGLRRLGIEPLIEPGPAALVAALQAASHVLVSVPPDAAGDPLLAQIGKPELPRLEWLGYLSTTGIYGDANGGWVDETTPPAPGEARSQRRLAAERKWLELTGRTRIFRLAGIYGPGRSALDKLADGSARRIVKTGQVFSRIHVADIARTVMASIAQPDIEGPFNLADGEPAPHADVVSFAAGLMGVDPPPLEKFEDADMSAMLRSFYDSSRRVSGEKTRRELGVDLAFPTYREGLAAIYST